MSVTFYSLDAPKDLVDRYDCQCLDFGDEPDENCYFCEGSGSQVFRSSSLSVQMSNANARDVLEALGLPAEDPLVGCLDTEEKISNVLQRIVQITNSDFNDPALAPNTQGGETFVATNENGLPEIKRKTTLIFGGRDAGYITKRLKQIQTLCQEALENGWTVTWS